jgi:hypothetical protein
MCTTAVLTSTAAVHLADGIVYCPVLLSQGLGQHSKAVADLQAAADIMPGDAEVS